jgi:hypothetical protein
MPHLPRFAQAGSGGLVRRKVDVREMTINHRKVDTQNPAYRPQNQFLPVAQHDDRHRLRDRDCP